MMQDNTPPASPGSGDPPTPTPRWALDLIRAGRVHEFYSSYAWRVVSLSAREAQHNECQRCKARGLYAPCEAVHHRRYLRDRPDLALVPSNLECLCRACHEAEHGRDAQQTLTPERW